MKSKLLLIVSVLAAAVTLSAETFKLRTSDLPDLVVAVAALDGADRIVDQGPGNPARVVREPYKFSGDVRARLAANLAVIQDALKVANAKRDGLIKQISGGGQSIDQSNKAQLAEFTAAASKLFDAEVVLELSPIATADLQLDQNAIPVSVLSVLAKLRTPTPAK